MRIDIIVLTETWLTDESNLKDYDIDGYHPPLIQNRDSKSGGGVLIYLHTRFDKFHIRKDLSFKDEFNHCLTVEYTYNKIKHLITACYRSPSDNNIERFLSSLECVIQKFKYKSTIAGDMNLNLINYQQHEETNNYYNLFTSNSYQLLTTNPTRITNETSSLIDHIWSNNLENEKISSYILVTDITDHLPCIYVEHSNSHSKTFEYVQYRQITNKNREYFTDSIKQAEESLNSHTTNCKTNTQAKYDNYFGHLQQLYDASFPIKKKKVHQKLINKPWIDADLQRLIKKKNRAFSKKTKSKTLASAENYKKLKNELTQKLQTAKKDYYCRKLHDESSTIKQKWDCLRTLIHRGKSSTAFCPIESKQLGTHYSTIAERLSKKLKNISYDDIPHSSHESKPYQTSNKTSREFTFTELTPNEIYEEILKLDKNKGPGPDNLDVKSVKSIANIIAPHLCTLFNLSVQDALYPNIFKKAKCVPIFKGSPLDPYLPVNYRPISILNCLNKTLERLLHNQMYEYMESNNIFPDFQYGYRKRRNTSQAVLKLNDIIETNKLKNKVTIAIFMDLSKAFDTVDKDILCSKLYNIGFSINSSNLIYDYMSDRTFCIKNDDKTTFTHRYGVPQGSILGPLLFLAYIHDMDTFCKHIEKIVYADDTTAIVTGRNINEAKQKANDILEQFYNYFAINKLTINEGKTKYMILDFRHKKLRSRDIDSTQLVMNNIIINQIRQIRFLGIVINDKLTWNDHKLHIKNSINKVLGIIYSCRNILKHSYLINIYNTFIYPFFNYCISLWGSSIQAHKDPLNVLQNKIMRIIFSCKRTEDAWNCDTKNQILTVKQLYYMEIAKLCYKQHNGSFLTEMNTMMPHMYDTEKDRNTKSVTAHNYKYTSKCSKTFPKNCIKLWNNLPTEIKDLAYTDSSNSLRHFTDLIRASIIQSH